MNPGIYIIKNTKNKNIYIGSSQNIDTRIRSHTSSLKRNKHGNKLLQKDYNIFGLKYFIFNILASVSIKDIKFLMDIEQCYLDKLNPFYNIKKKVIKINRGSKRRSFSQKDMKIMRKMYSDNISQKEIAKKFNINSSIVSRVINYRNGYTDTSRRLLKPKKINIFKYSKSLTNKIGSYYYNDNISAKKLAEIFNFTVSEIHYINTRFRKYNNIVLKNKHKYKGITNKEKLEIIDIYKNCKITHKELSKIYNCSSSSVARIINGQQKLKF